MIEAFRKIWHFAGNERKNINKSVAVGFLNAVLQMFQVAAIYFVVLALTGGVRGGKTAWIALICELVAIFGGAISASFSKMLQTHAGYFMAADRRISIANRLKSVPMGFFSDNSLGQISGVCTTVVGSIESMVPMVLVNILGGLITTAVFAALLLVFDWRIGLIVLAGIALYLCAVSAMEKKSAVIANDTQRSQTALIEAVLEAIQGMSVIKSFNLTGKGDKKLQDALEYNRRSNIEVSEILTPYTALQEAILQMAGVGMMLAAILLWISGSMSLANSLMVLVMSFLVFNQIKAFGMGVSMLRLAAAAIDRTEQTEDMPRMDESGKALNPRKHDIVFDHVSFSYEQKQILHDISATLPDKTTTAVIGPSGSGKTTFCSLIARFWDPDSGSVRIGGYDVKDYTLEALMDQISVVFQNVYLFADTIENNIKFGKPDATHDEVVAAAKAACCDDFIEALPDGYDTVIGEGGASLSGGEKQRISIARAMLKNAPIVILDEATANVDPENEDRLQKAIEALTRDKTIIMIAHRLKTVRHADQILVIDHGRIVQQGKHEQLIEQPGLYADFVGGKKQTVGWKL
ncbi:MAG: ABC transporter ATP-binding protein [Eubacteriales bacterium]|jgi:ATP-binding cassette subfamily B protein IrtB|nr:ABC transporter ATP-binding protein [Eubacteriales bacterium]